MKDGSAQGSLLSSEHKLAVRGWVLKARKGLEKEFRAQLERLGLRPDGKHVDVGRLNESDRAVRARVEALIARDARIEGGAKSGYENVVRELAYTLLNRLVGLKAMEARGLLYLAAPGDPKGPPEQTEVLTPIPGQAYSRYVRDTRAAGGSRYKYADDAEEALLRDALEAAFRQITGEIRLVFDPDHEYACVWPTHAALTEFIRSLNEDLPADAYRAQDFLGWVYQFFNREEKRKIRDDNKGTPRTPYELAVINQFYTPSWVVKVLVDNSLGRLWIQMHPDSRIAPEGPPPQPEDRDPAAPPVADYLVPRTGEKIRYSKRTEDNRAIGFKQARDVTLIDPACGTMHFGQYAFGLFEQMYLEEIEHAGEEGWPEEPSVTDPAQIPAAILEHNLHGIDIDPRAVQIAALSLFLTAKEAAFRLGCTPPEIQIRRTNLVVANAVSVGEERVRELVDKLAHRVGSEQLQRRLVAAVWDNLNYMSELGSLVQVREGVGEVLREWVDARAKDKGLTTAFRADQEQLSMAEVEEVRQREREQQLALQRGLVEAEARELEEELLRAVEAEAADHTDPGAQLFAEDTARGLALLRMLSRTYDVVVMNPPYGAFIPKVKDFVRAAYPLTYNDIYAAFIDRGTQLTEPEGYVGALVSSTFTTLKSFEKLRTEILLKRNPLLVMLDLGFGILDDATVEAAAIVIRGGARA